MEFKISMVNYICAVSAAALRWPATIATVPRHSSVADDE